MAIFTKKTENDKKAETVSGAPAQGSVSGLFLYPRVSEKAARQAQKSKYVFNVPANSNKIEIKKAVEKSYKINVVQVNIVNNQAKKVNFGRTSGERSGFKKAIVTLKAGDKIESSGPAS